MRSWIFTPAFCKAALLEQFLEHIYSHKFNADGFHHVIIDNHYPVDKDNNRKQIYDLARKFNCIAIDSGGDLGLHKGLNNAMQHVGVSRGDSFIGCDPDDRPAHGAFQAMRAVMSADPMFAVLGMNFWVLPWKIKDHGLVMQETHIAGHKIWIHPSVEMWNVTAFNMDFILDIGGFDEPNAYYGGLESYLYPAWKNRNMKMGYLVDYSAESAPVDRKDPKYFDQSYGDWKIAHAHKGYKKSFEHYLSETREWLCKSCQKEIRVIWPEGADRISVNCEECAGKV